MKAFVHMGSTELTLQHVLLIYSDSAMEEYREVRGDGTIKVGQCYASVHGVRSTLPPTLLEGRPVDVAFVRTLAAGLGLKLAPEVLPPHVLCRTPEVVVWWTPAGVRPMFFREGSSLGRVNGKHFPHPPLVWKLDGANLSVRALANDERPTASTPLYVAPYWNTAPNGLVCQGTMPRPNSTAIGALEGWVDAYFVSEFTHDFYGGEGTSQLTTLKGGVPALWKKLADKKGPFPARYLSPARQTLKEFVEKEIVTDA